MAPQSVPPTALRYQPELMGLRAVAVGLVALAHWSLADATLAYPLDPLIGADVVAGLLRERAAQRPVVRR